MADTSPKSSLPSRALGRLRRHVVEFLVCGVQFATRTAERLAALVGARMTFRDANFDANLERRETASFGQVRLTLGVPNGLTEYRARSFASKEPETLAWIDGFAPNSVLWDVGANVGLYALYAAARHPALRVFAFEPSIENLYLLNRNISENRLSARIHALPIALSDGTGFRKMRHPSLKFGGALSGFGVDHDQDGRIRAIAHEYQVYGFSADDLVRTLAVPQPNYLKVDVDGIEHLIAAGAKSVLAHPALREAMIELNFDFTLQRDTTIAILESCGLKLTGWKRAPEFDLIPGFPGIYNHFFARAGVARG